MYIYIYIYTYRRIFLFVGAGRPDLDPAVKALSDLTACFAT